MLTNAQSWRRLKSSRAKQRLRHEAEYLNDCQSRVDVPLRREESKVIIPNPTSSTADHTASTASSPTGRRVKFSSVIRVCLVPCRLDFQSDFHALFWMREDYQTFKEDAVRELRAHWLTNRTTVKEAIIDLYQPSAADYAASKTFLSHVDSVAQLRHLCLEQASSEDLVKLATPTLDLSCSNADSLLNISRTKNTNTYKESGALSVAVCSTSTSSSEEDSRSREVEAWSPTSTESNNSEAAQMGDAPSTTPLCLSSPSSAGTLLGQVTAPHVNPITPLRTDSTSSSLKDASKSAQESTQEPSQESKHDFITSDATPTKPLSSLTALSSAVTTSSASSSGSGTPASASRSHSPLLTPTSSSSSSHMATGGAAPWTTAPGTQPPSPSAASVLASAPARRERESEKEVYRDRDREGEKESKPTGEGLRIILMEDANSPASSISSFETPIMIYGQS